MESDTHNRSCHCSNCNTESPYPLNQPNAEGEIHNGFGYRGYRRQMLAARRYNR